MNLATLPRGVLSRVVSFLSPRSLFLIARVSRSFREVCTSDGVWGRFIEGWVESAPVFESEEVGFEQSSDESDGEDKPLLLESPDLLTSDSEGAVFAAVGRVLHSLAQSSEMYQRSENAHRSWVRCGGGSMYLSIVLGMALPVFSFVFVAVGLCCVVVGHALKKDSMGSRVEIVVGLAIIAIGFVFCWMSQAMCIVTEELIPAVMARYRDSNSLSESRRRIERSREDERIAGVLSLAGNLEFDVSMQQCRESRRQAIRAWDDREREKREKLTAASDLTDESWWLLVCAWIALQSFGLLSIVDYAAMVVLRTEFFGSYSGLVVGGCGVCFVLLWAHLGAFLFCCCGVCHFERCKPLSFLLVTPLVLWGIAFALHLAMVGLGHAFSVPALVYVSTVPYVLASLPFIVVSVGFLLAYCFVDKNSICCFCEEGESTCEAIATISESICGGNRDAIKTGVLSIFFFSLWPLVSIVPMGIVSSIYNQPVVMVSIFALLEWILLAVAIVVFATLFALVICFDVVWVVKIRSRFVDCWHRCKICCCKQHSETDSDDDRPNFDSS